MKRVQPLLLWMGLLALSPECALRGAAPPPVDADERELGRMGVATDDASLLRFLRERADAATSRIPELIADLAHDEFDRREAAARRLVLLGARAELRKHLEDDDLERRRRVKACLEAIDRGPPPAAVLHVVRLLGRRSPAGATAVLLAYLPAAPDEDAEEAVYYALAATALGRDEPALVAALHDASPRRRAAAGCLLAQKGKPAYREAIRKLLADRDVTVRLRSAQGLLAGGDKAGLPVLVELLGVESREVAWQAEELLHYAALESSPREVLGKGTAEERRRCVTAWRAWLAGPGRAVDLAAARRSGRRPGLVLTFEMARDWSGIRRVDKPRTARPKGDRPESVSLCGCEGRPRGEVMTFAEFLAAYPPPAHARRLCVWFQVFGPCLGLDQDVPGGSRLESGTRRPTSYFRLVAELADGRTLLVPTGARFDVSRCVEVDGSGRVVWEMVSDDGLGAFVLCPLVRFGFTGPGSGVDLDTVERRLAQLRHPDRTVRHLAVSRLRDLPRTDAEIGPLAEVMGQDDEYVRKMAVGILVKAGPKAEEATAGLVALLADDNVGVCMDAAQALTQCSDKVVEPLLAAYEAPGGRNRGGRRAYAIYVLGTKANAKNPRLHATIKGAFTSDELNVKLEVCQGLGRAGARARPYLPDLVRLFQDKDVYVKSWCLEALEHLGEDALEVLPDLEKIVRRTGWGYEAYGSVGRNQPAVAETLVRMLESEPGVEKAIDIVSAMGRHSGAAGLKRIVPALVQALKENQNRKVREAIAFELRNMGTRARAAVPGLQEFVVGSTSEEDAANAMAALKALDLAAAREARRLWFAKHPEADPAGPVPFGPEVPAGAGE